MHRFSIAYLLSLALPAAAVMAVPGPAINGIRSSVRVSNDFSTTTLVTVNGNSVNGGVASFVSITETNWSNDGVGGTFANRHDFRLSGDGGASDYFFDIEDSFTLTASVTLAAGSNAPRKEAGFRIDSAATGTTQFIVNTDSGEIVAFGGGAPFKLFGSSGGGNGYTPGTTILMGFTQTGGGDGVGGIPDTIEYFIDRGAGIETSGPLAWSNLEGGPVTYNVALYNQSSPNLQNQAEFVGTDFDNITYVVPEPTSLALAAMGLASLATMRRRIDRAHIGE